ncbi:MAG: DUF2339 domain-containing protein [Candidatus Methanoperedens sp.]|nr:DUF2339 domain-containing protein [Candidatus Methanoperedens sp.]
MGGISPGEIYNELAKIREEIKNIKTQIHSVEDRLDIYSEFVETQVKPAVGKITVKPEKQEEEYLKEEQEPELEEEKEPGFEGKKEPFFKGEKIGFEENIGKKWFSRIGIISIFIGMVLFLKYLYDRHLMSPVEKVGLGIFVGLVMLVAGGFLNNKKYEKKYEYLSRTLTGGGFAVLYLIIYTAYNPYRLIPADIDMILLGLIIVFAVFLSLRYSSMVIASEAFFLGYIIPFLGDISEYALVYATVLTGGLVIIVQRKGWINMAIGGLVAVYVTHISWLYGNNQPEDFAINALFLSIYFIIFTALAYTIRKPSDEAASLENFQSVLFKIPESYHGILIVALNAIFSYGLFYSVINANYKIYAGLFTMMVAGVYLCLAYAALNKNAKELFAIYLTLCTTFITIAIPVQFNYQWITFAWAIEGFVLLIMGFRYKALGLRVFGNIVGIIALVKTLFIDTGLGAFDIDNIFKSTRVFTFLITIITFYASSAMYFKNKDKPEYESKFWEYYLIGGVLLTTLILALELNDGWITIAWSIEGFILLLLGFRYNERIRVLANIVGIIIIAKILFMDTGLRGFDIDNLFRSTRFFAFLIPIIIFYASSILYFKNRNKLEYENEYWKYYLIGGVLLTTLILALELKGGLISAAWAIEAIAILIVGFRYESSIVRKAGIGLLLLTIVRVFIFDLAGLETLYRIMSFMVLGAILMGASFLYSKYKDRL